MSRHSRIWIAVLVVAAWAALAAMPAGAGSQAREGGTIRAIVRHNDGVTRPAPALAGVEVWVWDGAQSHHACTNSAGVARFTNMPEGAGYVAATGPSYGSPRCSNADFENPFTGDAYGRQMYTIYWNRHKGERVLDTFSVSDGTTRTLLFVTSTPPNQRKICAGLRVTIMGTTGDDTNEQMIVGDETDNVINGLGGDDTILGGAGNDFICGGPGKDTIDGGDGNDIIWGEAGLDFLDGAQETDVLYGGTQADVCINGETLIDCESSTN